MYDEKIKDVGQLNVQCNNYSAASSSLSLAIAAAGLRPFGQVFEPVNESPRMILTKCEHMEA